MKSSRHTTMGRRISSSLKIRRTTTARRCVACFEHADGIQMGRCPECFAVREAEVMRVKAWVSMEPGMSAAELMHRTGASAPVVAAFLRGGVDAALAARESLVSCQGSPMHSRDLVHAHHEQLLAASAASRFSAAH